jgi:myo-inositol-1(or 4)-monophosphatase
LVALEKSARPVIGVIDQPFTDERWVGAASRTTYSRGVARVRCETSRIKNLSEARVSTTDPRGAGYFSGEEAAAFAAIAESARFVRFSLDAYAYGLLALGELDLVIEASLKRHDFAALIPVIEGAGGVVTDWRGAVPGDDGRGRIVAAATPELHAAALERLRAL